MMNWTRRTTLIAGVALILLTNMAALLGAAYNQGGEPTSTLQLSERELQLPYWRGNKDNSGITLDLRWRSSGTSNTVSPYDDDDPAWLDKAKLASLGFDVSMPIDTDPQRAIYRKQLSKPVFLALEFDGPAYRHVIELAKKRDAEDLEKNEGTDPKKVRPTALSQELNLASRLFVVDAGLDSEKLRAKYPDTHHYCIVRGQIQPSVIRDEEKRPLMTGYIKDVAAQSINVPLEFRHVFVPILQKRNANFAYEENEKRPKFDATVAFGKRLEPWLAAASSK